MKTMPIELLIQKCVERMYRSGYSDACIMEHHRRWKKGICEFLRENGFTHYSTDVGAVYLENATKGYASSTARGRRRNIHILDQMLEHGVIANREKDFCKYPLPGDLGKLALRFIDKKKADGLAPLTITHHKRVLSLFISSMEISGFKAYRDLSSEFVLNFINSRATRKNERQQCIRSFLRFLVEEGKVCKNVLTACNGHMRPDVVRLPSYYEKEEIARLETHIDRSYSAGIRDYAVILLMTRLGLRSSDVAALNFGSILWDECKIRLIQKKTGVPLELPLLKEIGEAIIKYLKYVRPKTDFQEIFCTVTMPFRPLNNMSINDIVSAAFKRAGIQTKGRHFGAHSLRHSLASNMLANGTPLSTISSVLGHSSTSSTIPYLKIDTASLKEYALEVPPVNEHFYSQKGGAFYE